VKHKFCKIKNFGKEPFNFLAEYLVSVCFTWQSFSTIIFSNRTLIVTQSTLLGSFDLFDKLMDRYVNEIAVKYSTRYVLRVTAHTTDRRIKMAVLFIENQKREIVIFYKAKTRFAF